MRIIRDLASIPADARGATVALGNFDGVHLGHLAILRHTIATAKATGGKAAVMTFEPHPREFFSKSGEKLRLYSFRDKVKLLKAAGIELLFVMRFNHKLASLSAHAFVEELLHKTLSVRHVVTGYNFAFGKGRQGNTEFLDKTAAALGIGYTACPPVYDAQGEPVSSSAIRAALAAGDMEKASFLLGRPYAVTGRVQRGERRGRKLGFPTANLSLDRLFKPRLGIYAARISVIPSPTGGGLGWGQSCAEWKSNAKQASPPPSLPPAGGGVYDGVASIGVNPTFGTHKPLLEAHIFDKDMDLYGRRLRVELSGFIRDERRFDDVGALKMQMAEDARVARRILDDRR